MLRALLYAYVLGGITFIPLVVIAAIFITVYTSVPVGDTDIAKKTRGRLEADSVEENKAAEADGSPIETNDTPRTRKGWLTMRRTFEESVGDGGYVTLVRSFLDSRSKDPKRSRPKDMWYVVLKGKVLYLYEDEGMSECEAAVELSGHQVVIYPEGLADAELFAKRNAICLKPKGSRRESMPSLTKEMHMEKDSVDEKLDASSSTGRVREVQREVLLEEEKKKNTAREEALDPSTPWFIFVRSNVEMEDWYFSLIHASEQPAQTPILSPLRAVFEPADMNHLVSTLDEQPDVIPMRWLNALLGRIFFSYYRTHNLEAYIIGRLMKKLSKVKCPAFLTEIEVTQVSVGNKAPMLSKPMLKELTKEGDASLEVHFQYKGEVRITVEATAVINLGARFKSYTVKLALAAVLKELEGNLLIKVKRPPSNRIWYAFTQTPRIVLEVEPIVSDRQITWGMILSTIESKFKEIIQESVVMPNMDDIAFFETAQYEHRGGIWSDACRKPRVPTTVPSAAQEDAQSVPSVPLPDTISISSGYSTPVSKPTDDLSVCSAPPTTSIPMEGTLSTTSTIDDSNDSTRTRRRTWFSSVRSEDLGSLSPNLFSDNDQGEASEEHRGRTLEPEKPTTPRSHSTPNNTPSHDASPKPLGTDESEPSQSQVHLPIQYSHRSASQHSLKLELELQDEEPVSRAKSTPTTPRKNSDASQTARPPSPPSFFSTLKAKAADKQAISNTAKEAMRKWGVNWAGFKKDANNGSQSSDESGTSPPRSSLRPESSSSLTQKARASYAEVRAAVAERKERERSSQLEDNSETFHPSSHTATPRTRAVSTPKATMPNGSVYSETPINPSIVTSAARLSTPKLSTKKSSPSISRVHTEMDAQDLPEPEEPTKHAPIHVQPQAKTMSIPGIHASHRGEVQSMGHVAPQLPAPSGPSETMLKNPAIQTVYRLWKNPSSHGQDTEPQAQPGQHTEPAVHGEPNGDSVAALAPSPNLLSPPQPLVKPTPPPLPPRSISIAISRPGNSASSGSSPPSSSASEALKNIVQKDETNRTQPTADSVGPSIATSETAKLLSDASQAADSEADTSRPVVGPTADSLLSNAINRPPHTDNTPPALPPRRIQTPA